MEIKMANISVLHLFKNTEKNMNLKKKMGGLKMEILEMKIKYLK